MNYFPCGDGNTKVNVDGVLVNLKNIQLRSGPITDIQYTGVPYGGGGPDVVLGNEIHVLGADGKHRKWNGSAGGAWTEVSIPPYGGIGVLVVLNNEIHLLGGKDHGTDHYKWDGTTWTSVSTLPYDFNIGSAVVLNGEIHILGGPDNMHYKWDGSVWTKVSDLPGSFRKRRGAVVFDNEIYILGIPDSSYNHYNDYKWNGSTWTQVYPSPSYNAGQSGSMIVFDNKIHVFEATDHYQWSGGKWVKERNLPYAGGDSAVVLDDGIHLVGTGNGHYCLNTNDYVIVVKRY